MQDGEYASYEEILPLLNVVKREHGRVRATCPVHKDGRESYPDLVLFESGVLQCMVGCSFKDIMRELRKHAPLRERLAAPPPTPIRRPTERKTPLGEPVAVYQYRDITGKLIAEKARFEPPGEKKQFLWRLPGDTDWGGFKKQLTMEDVPLWGADILAKEPLDVPVLYVEGEKAAEAARQRGLLAVTFGGGAGSRSFGEALDVLTGRDVILWPDNAPDGREYMQVVRASLKDIARSIRVISPPVPPKGDAFDYFAAGGSVEDLLANHHREPVLECIGAEHVRVTVPTDLGLAAFDFDEIHQSGRGELLCELTVSLLLPGAIEEPYAQRINLLSASARRDLVSALGQQFGKDAGMGGWTKVVSVAYSRVLQAQREGIQVAPFSMAETEERDWLIDEILPARQVSIIYAPPAAAKSYFCQSMALAVTGATEGGKFAGEYPVSQGAVLYIDYENTDDRQTLDRRFTRLLRGAGLSGEELPGIPLFYMPGGGMALADQIRAVRRVVEQNAVQFIIVDSIGPAMGGDMFDTGATLRLFAALGKVPATWLLIGQVPDADQEKLYGNAYFRYAPHGNIYLLRRDGGKGEDESLDLGLVCMKTSEGRWPKPRAFRLEFDGDTGPVRLTTQSFRELVAFERDLSVQDRIVELMRSQPRGKWQVHEIAKELGVEVAGVRSALNKGKGHSFSLLRPEGQGESWAWALQAL